MQQQMHEDMFGDMSDEKIYSAFSIVFRSDETSVMKIRVESEDGTFESGIVAIAEAIAAHNGLFVAERLIAEGWTPVMLNVDDVLLFYVPDENREEGDEIVPAVQFEEGYAEFFMMLQYRKKQRFALRVRSASGDFNDIVRRIASDAAKMNGFFRAERLHDGQWLPVCININAARFFAPRLPENN